MVSGPISYISYIGLYKFLLYLFHGLLHILLPLLSGGRRGACDVLRKKGLNQRQRKSFLSLLFSGVYPKWFRLLCWSRCPYLLQSRNEKSSSRSLFVLVPVKGPVDGPMFKSYYRVRAAFCVRLREGNRGHKVRDRFPFMRGK